MAAEPPLHPDRLFRRLAGARGLVLAVSGGPDSTALMALMARWGERPPVLVVSVDHGLRPEAADEARIVAENAARLGLPCRIVRAPERPAGGNLQDWARRARYRCLADAAQDAGFDAIVTAHHRDDQAETFLLRLARGSGVYGLSAMAEEGMAAGLRLARPLLAVPRASLVEFAASTGLPLVADPSNHDPAFDRVRMRALMPALAQHGLTAERLADTAAGLKRAAAALDHYCDVALRDNFRVDSFGVLEGRAAAFADVPEEVGLRALGRLLTAVGGADYSPRLDSLEDLRDAILSVGERGGMTRTLHGAVVAVKEGILRVRREWGRSGLSAVTASGGDRLLWDRRFSVAVPHTPECLSVGPLGHSDRRLRSDAADRATIKVLPGLFDGRALVAIPDGILADDGELLGRLETECVVPRRLRPDAAFIMNSGC